MQNAINYFRGNLFPYKTHFWEIDMEIIVLSLMTLSLLMIFAVDTIQKRRRYLNKGN
jgi:hypothetical protein